MAMLEVPMERVNWPLSLSPMFLKKTRDLGPQRSGHCDQEYRVLVDYTYHDLSCVVNTMVGWSKGVTYVD